MEKGDRTITIYTLVHTATDTDRGYFQTPDAWGSYTSLASARTELERRIASEKERLDERYNCEERSEDTWEMYQDGYAAAGFSRIEILASTLYGGEPCGPEVCR